MKRCPKCALNYNDDSLEFCLEDGTRLVSATVFDAEIPTVTHGVKNNPTAEKTVAIPFSPNIHIDSKIGNSPQSVPQTTFLKKKAIEKTNKILEPAPLFIALAHNWWQWIYLNNQSYTSFSAYVFSANFIIWLILLAAGAIIGSFSFRNSKNKSFAVAGLVILAINFILFMVPKR